MKLVREKYTMKGWEPFAAKMSAIEITWNKERTKKVEILRTSVNGQWKVYLVREFEK